MRGEIRASLARYLPDYEAPFGGADHDRVAFYARCKLIEDVAYGIGTPGAHRNAEAGLSRLARTFGALPKDAKPPVGLPRGEQGRRGYGQKEGRG